MLLDNINPAKQLANGTRGEFWGLVWDKPFDLVPGSTPPWRFRDEGEEPMTVRDFVDVSPGEDVWVPPPCYVVMRYKRADRSDDFVAVARRVSSSECLSQTDAVHDPSRASLGLHLPQVTRFDIPRGR